jgi:hypothetical protein
MNAGVLPCKRAGLQACVEEFVPANIYAGMRSFKRECLLQQDQIAWRSN